MKGNLFSIVKTIGWSLIILGCCPAPPRQVEPLPPAVEEQPASEAPLPVESEVSVKPIIWTTVEQVKTECEQHLNEVKKIRDEIAGIQGERTLENTLKRLNDLYFELSEAISPSSFFINVSPQKEVREACEKCKQEAMDLASKLRLDRGIYDALKAFKVDDLDALAKRFVDKELRDYRRAGVDKDEGIRAKLEALNQEITKLEIEYSRRVRETKYSIEVEAKDLAGMPKDYIESHKPGENGKITITTEYPDMFPILNYADNEKVRKDICTKNLNRAYPENEKTLKKVFALRYEYATMLGYEDWAAYNAEDKMVKDKKTIADFVEKVVGIAKPRMDNDLKDILKEKKKDNKNAKVVEDWDRFYYVNKIRANRFDVDAQFVRSYFDYPRVRDGILSIASELFGLTYKKVENTPVWHESVEVYDVLDGDDLIGRFYLDMHPRDGKFGHAAQFEISPGMKGRQLPVSGLACNFKEPSADGPGLMSHDEVTTFFHEFGHLMHSLLGGRQEWTTMGGTATEWDFVETPSQFFEEWAWDYDMLKRFAVHYETKEVIPQDLVEKMRLAEGFGKGMHVQRQMFLAALSFHYHSQDPAKMDLLETMKKVQKDYNPYPYTKDTHFYTSFGHLIGYSSGYYTYMWSLVITKDLFTKFKEAGLMDKQTALSFRKNILEPGGSIDANVMLNNFLGRDYSFDAFKEWLEK